MHLGSHVGKTTVPADSMQAAAEGEPADHPRDALPSAGHAAQQGAARHVALHCRSGTLTAGEWGVW